MPDAVLVSWNVAGRLRRLPEQAERVGGLAPDIVCLQEVIASAVTPWSERLAGAGLSHLLIAEPSADGARGRPLLTLVAARCRQQLVAVDAVPWPERVLATRLAGLEVVNVHSPISPKPGLAKVLTHEAVQA
ncbi:MAG TPA: hypothetical protein VFN65_02045, partial [Solirubrobacteraceae bacterium]|nr:hypothetical protein [Solirubrobacteraceae bacterium]